MVAKSWKPASTSREDRVTVAQATGTRRHLSTEREAAQTGTKHGPDGPARSGHVQPRRSAGCLGNAPTERTARTKSALREMPSLTWTRLRSSRTVASLRFVATAISRAVAPLATAIATSLSAGVRPSAGATCLRSVRGFVAGSTMSTDVATGLLLLPTPQATTGVTRSVTGGRWEDRRTVMEPTAVAMGEVHAAVNNRWRRASSSGSRACK